MPSLMPLPERSLTLPVALAAAPPRALPPGLCAYVSSAQAEARAARDAHAARPSCEECGHEYRAALEIAVGAWQEAVCPAPSRRVRFFTTGPGMRFATKPGGAL